jgi:hypothetical protein
MEMASASVLEDSSPSLEAVTTSFILSMAQKRFTAVGRVRERRSIALKAASFPFEAARATP